MALGIFRLVPNKSPKFGSNSDYLFIKVEAEKGGKEEYWLLTVGERERFKKRAARKNDLLEGVKRGVFRLIKNTSPTNINSNKQYFRIKVKEKRGSLEDWLLTDYELKRVRHRTRMNSEDIEANRESWFMDLFD